MSKKSRKKNKSNKELVEAFMRGLGDRPHLKRTKRFDNGIYGETIFKGEPLKYRMDTDRFSNRIFISVTDLFYWPVHKDDVYWK